MFPSGYSGVEANAHVDMSLYESELRKQTRCGNTNEFLQFLLCHAKKTPHDCQRES